MVLATVVKADADHGLVISLPTLTTRDTYPLSRARAITRRWIWLVPS